MMQLELARDLYTIGNSFPYMDTGRQFTVRINIFNAFELKYWSEQLNTSPDNIRNAVYAVGDILEDVKEYLESHPYNEEH